jgi:hypothetical protein
MGEYILHDKDLSVVLKASLNATSINIADAGSFFTGTEVETALQEVGQQFSVHNTGGFEDRTNSTLSWDRGTRTMTLTPTGTDYYWVGGKRYSYASPLTAQITDVTGTHVIHFDAATPTALSVTANPSVLQMDDIILNDAIVAIVYWNTSAGYDQEYLLADERHGVAMSGATHHWIHDSQGSQYGEGGDISGYTLDTDSDAAISFDVTDIRFYDEDLEHVIEDGVVANQYEQVLTGDAEIPVLFREDVAGGWTEQAASTLPYIVSATPQPTYNNDDGDGTWSQVELGNNKFMNYFLVATNDWVNPVKMVQGSAEYANKVAAQVGAADEVIAWSGLDTPNPLVVPKNSRSLT